MNVVRSNFTILALLITAFVTTACGGNASLSPVGPSSPAGSGASIAGTISGSALAPLAIEPGSFSMLETKGITISIVGTGISTTADNHGQFTLNNVPSGTVTLNFSGPGANATITLTGVGPDDKVQIAVTVNGNSAHVDSEHHSAPDNNKREFQGRITSIDTTAKSVQIPGMTIKTTATTVIRHGNRTMQFTDLKVGNHVEARGAVDGTTLTATEIKVEDDSEDDHDSDEDAGKVKNDIELRGVVASSTGQCPSVAFNIQTTKVTVNKDTAYPKTSCADATKNGVNVKVAGVKQADGSVMATSVSVEAATTPTSTTVNGLISGSTGTCPAVTFTVQSTKITVNSATTYTQTSCADATKNGANVKVTGTKQTDGSVVATSVALAQ